MEQQQQASSSSSSPSSSSTSSILFSSSPAIDRYNPIIRDSRRISKLISDPCNPPQPPVSPKPHNKKNKKPLKQKGEEAKKNDDSSTIIKPDYDKIKVNSPRKNDFNTSPAGSVLRESWSCTKPGGIISPPGSTRYLLSDRVFFNSFSDFDQAQKSFPAENSRFDAVTTNESFDAKASSLSCSSDQVVVLRVSLHCRGCERKMRKHISRMEGVTSFNIDFAAKKVTVAGNITPLEVLSSISKVKNAQIFSPAISSSSVPSSIYLSNPEFKNEYKGAGA